MPNEPKVSIIIPCYNAENWIQQCLESALNQDYNNVEVIFVDNESTDASVEIVDKIKNNYPNLITDNAPNVYPNCWDEARSKGFELMSGDYVLVMGADDYIEPSFIKNCMKYILAAPEKVKAFQSPIKGVKQDTGIIVNTVSHSYRSLQEFKNLAINRCPVNTPTVIYNTELYRNGLLETMPETYGGAADYDLYCKLAQNDILIYPAPQWLGFYYRWHEQQATWKVHSENKNYDKMIQDYWRNEWSM